MGDPCRKCAAIAEGRGSKCHKAHTCSRVSRKRKPTEQNASPAKRFPGMVVATVFARDDALAQEMLADREAAISKKETALAERETALADRETALADREAAVSKKETALIARAAELSSWAASVATDQKRALDERKAVIASWPAAETGLTMEGDCVLIGPDRVGQAPADANSLVLLCNCLAVVEISTQLLSAKCTAQRIAHGLQCARVCSSPSVKRAMSGKLRTSEWTTLDGGILPRRHRDWKSFTALLLKALQNDWTKGDFTRNLCSAITHCATVRVEQFVDDFWPMREQARALVQANRKTPPRAVGWAQYPLEHDRVACHCQPDMPCSLFD